MAFLGNGRKHTNFNHPTTYYLPLLLPMVLPEVLVLLPQPICGPGAAKVLELPEASSVGSKPEAELSASAAIMRPLALVRRRVGPP
jgi:hypothetical protein